MVAPCSAVFAFKPITKASVFDVRTIKPVAFVVDTTVLTTLTASALLISVLYFKSFDDNINLLARATYFSTGILSKNEYNVSFGLKSVPVNVTLRFLI